MNKKELLSKILSKEEKILDAVGVYDERTRGLVNSDSMNSEEGKLHQCNWDESADGGWSDKDN